MSSSEKLVLSDLPFYADVSCVQALLGPNYSPFVYSVNQKKVRNSDCSGNTFIIRCDVDVSDQILKELSGAQVCGQVISIKRMQYEKRTAPCERTDIDRTSERSAKGDSTESMGSTFFVDQIRTKSDLQSDACRYCGSLEHFSRKCPRKNELKQ